MQSYEQALTLYDDLEVIFEFYKEGEASEEDLTNRYEKLKNLLEDLEFKNMLSEAILTGTCHTIFWRLFRRIY